MGMSGKTRDVIYKDLALCLVVKGGVDKEGHKERGVSSGVEGVGSVQAERAGKGIGAWTEHEWSLLGKWGGLLGTQEAPSPGEVPMFSRSYPEFAPTFSTQAFAWVVKQYSTFALSWVLSVGWGQAGSEGLGLPTTPLPSSLPLSAVSRWSQAS